MLDFLNWLWLSLLFIAFIGTANSWFDKSQSFINDDDDDDDDSVVAPTAAAADDDDDDNDSILD